MVRHPSVLHVVTRSCLEMLIYAGLCAHRLFLGLSISLCHCGVLVGVHVCGTVGEEEGRVGVQLCGWGKVSPSFES